MYQLRLDWATINFDSGTMSRSEVGQKLAGMSDLRWTAKGLSENATWNSPLGLRWNDNSGWAETPHKLQVSGSGCEHFAATLPALRDREHSHFSRLDFAFDVVMDRQKWREFICTAFQASMFSDRQYKQYKLTGTGEAMTIYIGSRGGSKYFRIYNKSLQDTRYEYHDPVTDEVILLDENQCVIRYEVELHRHKRVSGTHVRLFDPSPMFDAYYSVDPGDEKSLFDTVRSMWLSFGNEVLLPEGFAEAEFSRRITNKTKNFVALSTPEGQVAAVEEVKEKLHAYPRSFEHILQFIVSRYGQYIPYIIADEGYSRDILTLCENRFGFVPESVIVTPPAGYYDVTDELEEDEDFPAEWNIVSGDQLGLWGQYSDEGRDQEWLS